MKYWIKTPRTVPLIFFRLLWRVSPYKPVVYLTFDDGPNDSTTSDILKILEREKVKGTFFCIGNNVVKNPEIFKEITEKGHRVGNHSMSHVNGWKVMKNKYLKDIEKADKIIKSNLFRPPYGKLNFRSTSQLKKKFEIVMRDINRDDFDKTQRYSQVIETVLNNTRNGSIIVFHDSVKAAEKMKYALPKVLQIFSDKGFSFSKIN